ncbi:MAG: hypothetical protein AABX51_00350 [Nanoarchaeota archaeon]
MWTLTSSKGQSAVEAAMLFAFMLTILTVFLLAMGNQYVSTQETHVKNGLIDVGAMIETELKLGATAQDGYYRRFEIPRKAGGVPFKIQFYDTRELGTPGTPIGYSEVDLAFVNSSILFETFISLPDNVDGNISHGIIELRKRDGILYVMNESYTS